MATKKHPRVKVEEDFTYEKGALNAFDRGRAICPDGMKYDSVFWETTPTATGFVRRAVGIYKVKGKSDVQLYLDTAEERTRRAKTADTYMTMVPPQPWPTPFRVPTDVNVPINHPKKITPIKMVVTRLLKEKDISIILWAADGKTEWSLKARSIAKALKVKIPVRKKHSLA